MSKEEYLKKYLSTGKEPTRRKKLKKTCPAGLKIIDEDVDVKHYQANDCKEVDDAPTVAAVIDERPKEIQILETYRQDNRWKALEDPTDKDLTHSSMKRTYPLHSSDSDLSPTRPPNEQQQNSQAKTKPSERMLNDSDSDLSPGRSGKVSLSIDKDKHKMPHKITQKRRHDSSDSDQSPARREPVVSSDSKHGKNASHKNDSTHAHQPVHEPLSKTDQRISHKVPHKRPSSDGDQSPTRRGNIPEPDLKLERRPFNKQSRKKEEQVISKEQQQRVEYHSKISKGVTQQQERHAVLEEMAYQASKPLARYKDDADLNEMRRNEILEGDPLAEYIRKKKKKQSNIPDKPKYSGPQPPQNRFNILPGYRWDGVDRSNGFEKKLLMHKSNKKALEIEAHKWSVEDM